MPLLCPPGKYTADENHESSSIYDRPLEDPAVVCLDCPTDYYCPEWGITGVLGSKTYTTFTCPAGYICESGAIHPSSRDDIKVKFCPVGSFCDKSIGLFARVQLCPINYYANIEA